MMNVGLYYWKRNKEVEGGTSRTVFHVDMSGPSDIVDEVKLAVRGIMEKRMKSEGWKED